ncbi:MAG: YfiR family protein [Candidatus Marinimicrobia bacterium]|nr:YfiR family protein [Candidatus Neomarinimicrobiota bacterium]
MMKKILKYITVLFLISSLWAQETEYILKSAFLEKFCKFTEWEKEKIDSSAYFYITLLGENEFGELLNDLFSKLKIKDKPVKIQYVQNLHEIEIPPHLIFISKDQKKNLDKIIQYSKINNILTVGDTENYGKLGVHINFYITQENTLHFTINLASVQSARLRINLLLLEIAKVI